MKPLALSVFQNLRYFPPIIAQRVRSILYPYKSSWKGDSQFDTRSQTGSLFPIRISDIYSFIFSVHGYNEWRSWAIALSLCSKGDTIVEIGANIGTETVGFSDIVGSSGKVFAFEPFPSNVDMLKNVLNSIRFKNIIILPFAVGEKCEKVYFSPPGKENTGNGHILTSDYSDNENKIEVDCINLDSMSEKIGDVKMIFMDAEGAEGMILRGSRELINKYKPHIVLEAAPSNMDMEKYNLTVKNLYDEIINLGYFPFFIGRFGLVKNNILQIKENNPNWLCLHRDNLSFEKNINKYIKKCGLYPCFHGINPMTMKSV